MTTLVTLQCDAPKCGWSAPIDFAEAEQQLERACPDCGAVVLTKEDYLATKAALDLCDAVGIKVVDPGEGTLTINPHDGNLNLSIKDWS